MRQTSVIVTGSLAFDHIMSMPGRFRDHILPDKLHILNVSFLMDTMRREYGGTGGNQAYTLALLGCRPRLVAAAGKDFAEYRKHLDGIGVDVSGVRVFPKAYTATGFVTTDQDDNQIWGFYGGAMRLATRVSIRRYLNQKSLVVIAPNDPQAMTNYARQCREKGISFLFDPAFYIPRLSARELRVGVANARVVIGNDYEVGLLMKRARLTEREILRDDVVLVTTLGEKGSVIQQGRKRYRIPAARPQNTSDPTGAGDAYRAGFLAGFLRGFTLDVCGRMGSLAAVYTVEKYGTQTHRFSLRQFEKRYRENFGESLAL